jgi:hypothetical protein
MSGHLDAQSKPHTDRRDLYNLRKMLPYLWDYRGRALFALSCLVLSKAANVGVPVVLKEIVDLMERSDKVALALPLLLLLGYGLLKLGATLFNELRDAIFARVRYHAMRGSPPRCSPTCTASPCAFIWTARPAASPATWSAARAASAPCSTTWCSASCPHAGGVLPGRRHPAEPIRPPGSPHHLRYGGVYMAFTFAITEWRMNTGC